jgi:phosphatidylglycerophosphate synthase
VGRRVSNEVAAVHPHSSPKADLAFKAYEIEELADVYFFRPLGMAVARAARALRMTPTLLTVVAALVGVAAGSLLRDERFGLLAFTLLMVHSVLDSSDGQLARMTGTTSEFGRVLDGFSGYLTHIAIYLALIWNALTHGGGAAAVALLLAAAVSNVVHAQMYDYHRSTYTMYAINGVLPVRSGTSRMLLSMYEALQRKISRPHQDVEAALAARGSAGRVRDDDRRRYRQFFYATVRGWNLLGDNTRFYLIGLLAALHRLQWFSIAVLVPMNAAFVALWIWQARRDRLFVSGL